MGRHADEARVKTASERRMAYKRARSRAEHAASQELRERHRAEYAALLVEALKHVGLDPL